MSIAKPQSGDHAPAFQTYLNDVGSFADALDIYHAQEAILAAMVGWPEAKAGYRYADGKWSVREVVGHMADTERIMAYRLLRIARGDGTPLAGFDENAYQLTSGFESRPWPASSPSCARYGAPRWRSCGHSTPPHSVAPAPPTTTARRPGHWPGSLRGTFSITPISWRSGTACRWGREQGTGNREQGPRSAGCPVRQ